MKNIYAFPLIISTSLLSLTACTPPAATPEVAPSATVRPTPSTPTSSATPTLTVPQPTATPTASPDAQPTAPPSPQPTETPTSSPSPASSPSAAAPSPEPPAFSLASVRTVMAQNCIQCHGGGRPTAGVALDNDQDLIRFGQRVYQRAAVAMTMPPSGALSPAEKEVLEMWKDAGFSAQP